MLKDSYSKGKYVKVELSHFEFSMIEAILLETTHNPNDWFTERNLDDLKELFIKFKEVKKLR